MLRGKDILSVTIQKSGDIRHFQISKKFLLASIFTFLLVSLITIGVIAFNIGYFVNISFQSYIKQNLNTALQSVEKTNTSIVVDSSQAPTQAKEFGTGFGFFSQQNQLTNEVELIQLTNVSHRTYEGKLQINGFLQNVTEPHRLLKGRFMAMLWNNKVMFTSPATINFADGTLFKWENIPTFSFNKLRPLELIFSPLPADLTLENYTITLLFFDDGKGFMTKINYKLSDSSNESN